MADITISMSNVVKTKTVLIEPLGEFKVRRLGAGESLDLSAKQRRLNNILIELEAFDLNAMLKITDPTEEEQKLLNETMKKSDSLMQEVSDIRVFELDTFKKCFDDSGSGNTQKLFDQLPLGGAENLLEEIFNPKIIEDKKEEVEENA